MNGMETIQILVTEKDTGKRADVFLVEQLEGISRSAVQNLLDKGQITVNGAACRKNRPIAAGDVFFYTPEEPVTAEILPENIPLEIVYEDSDLLVVNKPKGLCVHPAPGNERGTLVNALMYHCGDSLSGINGVIRPGIVHRIDKDTSGLLIVAKNDRAHVALAEQISAHSFDRQYEAVAFGAFSDPCGEINLPIGRSDRDRKKMAVTEKGRSAKTRYETLATYSDHGVTYSHLRLTLYTGRTHQIRVHCASKGHPIAGDDVYGNADRDHRWFPTLEGQCLHARSIGFVHPTTGEYLSFTSELPVYFRDILTKLSHWSKISVIE